jgi:hypothetical protein
MKEMMGQMQYFNKYVANLFIGHRRSWFTLMGDGTVGYFYDPDRGDSEGAFFYHFDEDGDYVWFPSFQNFLAGVIEYHSSGAVKQAPDGELEEDYDKTEEIWSRFGEARMSDYEVY